MTLEVRGANLVGHGNKLSIDGGTVQVSGQHSMQGLSFNETEITFVAGSQVEMNGGDFRHVQFIFSEPSVVVANGARFTTFSEFVSTLLAGEVRALGGKLAEPFKSRYEHIVLHLEQTSQEFDAALDILNAPAFKLEDKERALRILESWSGAIYPGSDSSSVLTKSEAQHFAGTPQLDLIRIRLDGIMEALRSQAIQLARCHKTSLQAAKTQVEV